MSKIRPRIFNVLLFLFFSHCSFAKQIFVNVNNATPGAGTSWATAYNDLSAAIATALTNDVIWVAKGTYKPAVVAGRSSTFLLSGNIPMYGGFAGTETAISQRNIKANPTILSGDIGVPGVATDNVYHVLTLQKYANGPAVDGFTIRDGYADAGYPAATTPIADNCGGGAIVLAHTGDISYGILFNCTFSNNFAVNGGGLCIYGEGTSAQSFYLVGSCFFDNNSAVMGGATASIANNGDWGNGSFQNCIYTNNTSISGKGSVMASSCVNPYTTLFNNVGNCTMYNNGEPVFYSEQTGGTSIVDAFDNIIWKSGAPYAGPLNVGPGTDFSHTTVYMTTPPGSNFNFDPQFVDAAAGDFHVRYCSPVVDGGLLISESLITDMDGQPRVQGNAIDLGAYEQAKPLTPTPNNVSYCQYATAVPVTATGTPGNTILWYPISNGPSTTTAPTPTTTSPTYQYIYLSQIDALGCESPQTVLIVTIKSGSTTPTASNVSYCQNATATALTATGTGLLWYTDATTGTGSTTAPTPTTTAAGTTTYYVTQTQTGKCESTRKPVVVTVGLSGTAPTATDVAYCENATAAALTATGTNLLWYTDATTGTGSTTAPTPVTTTAGTFNWYVSQTPAGSCESSRTPLTVTINTSPAAPVVNTVNYCQDATPAALTASGANLLWYTSATSGTGNTTAPTPTTNTAGTTNYYVTQTVGCESQRALAAVVVTPNPAADFDFTNACDGSKATVELLPATSMPDSYAFDFGTTATATGSGAGPYQVNWNGTGDYTVLLTSHTGACEKQITHTVSIYPQPNVQISPVTGSVCTGKQINLTASGATSYQWSPATGLSNTAVSNPVATMQSTIGYTVTGTDNNGCTDTAQITLHPSLDCLVYSLPDGFTPNGDGHNDVFRVLSADIPQSFHMVVYNRYGQRVFESTDISKGWNGLISGNQAIADTYVYAISIKTSLGTAVEKKGAVVLIR